MALTNEDLQAIQALLGNAATKDDIAAINTRLDTIEGKQDAMSADLTRLNHTIEPQLKIIRESIDGLQERYNRLDRVEAKQDDHGHRIWALEQAVKAK